MTSAAVLRRCITRLGGRHRPGQQQMAEAVAQAVETPGVLFVQAGTGTGKSLGYLAPAAVHAMASGQRVIVSTATLALQRQLMNIDAPLVSESLAEETGGPRPRVSVLKGWQNYLCRHKLAGGFPQEDNALFELAAAAPAADSAPEHPDPSATSELGGAILRLRQWAEDTDTGDRDDLEPGVSDRAWRQVSVTKRECLGSRCPMLEECFAENARRAAHEADLVITNHAMLGIAAAGSSRVLPEHDVLVVDEAHELVDRVTAQGTLELSSAVVDRATRLARRQGLLITELEESAAAVGRALLELRPGRLRRLPVEIQEALSRLASGCREALTALRGSGAAQDVHDGGKELARAALQDLQDTIHRFLDGGIANRRDVAWCDRGSDGSLPPRLKLAPLDVAGNIADNLFTDRSVVLTSATLALGGSFEAIAHTTGATLLRATGGAPWQGIDVGSPFDYPQQGILYIAAQLPAPGREGPNDAASAELVELVRAAGGGTLGLFTSHRAAQHAAQVLREQLDTPVLCQGEGNLPSLLRQFAIDEATTLVGTMSLWQGVDIPGKACRLVVIDRIPFPRPDDPVHQARAENAQASGGNGFMQVSATHAALRLAQGAGRLIRAISDRGVVAVLDSRLATARYRGFLLNSMPPLWPTTDGEIVRAALRRLAAAPGSADGAAVKRLEAAKNADDAT